MCLRMTFFKLLPHLPGANELNRFLLCLPPTQSYTNISNKIYCVKSVMEPNLTRTIRTPAFWDTLCRPMLVIQIRSQVKSRQSQSYKFWKIAKNSNFKIFAKNVTCDTPPEVACRRYRADMGCGADGRMDGRTKWNQYTPQQICCIIIFSSSSLKMYAWQCLTMLSKYHLVTALPTGYK